MTMKHITVSYDKLKDAAATFFGELGVWAYDTWAELNGQYFMGANEPGPIVWGLTPHGKCLGSYHSNRNQITLHTSLVEPKTGAPWMIDYMGKLFAKDVLLHEMMHQRIHQYGLEHSSLTAGNYTSHNCGAWVDEVNRISKLMGVDVHAEVVRQKRVDGKVKWYVPDGCLTVKELASFPGCIRKAGHYR